MSGETSLTIVGNLTDDPTLRWTPSGAAVANFTVASTPRQFDKNANEWRDGDPLFLSCSIWREAAENVAGSLEKGMRVIVTGRLRQESYEAKDGSGKRTAYKVDVDEVGPALRYATAKVTRTRAGQGPASRQQQQSAGGSSDPWAAAQPSLAADPWATTDDAPAPF